MPPTALAARFGLILDILCRAVAARGPKGVLAVPLLILLWTRLRRTAARFAALAAAAEAGATPPRRRIGRRRTPADRPVADRPTATRLPRRFAWLLAPIPEAAGSAAQLRHFLAEPEVDALIAADPRFGRLLRPLCRTLGLRLPTSLRPPPRSAPGEDDPAAPKPRRRATPSSARPPSARPPSAKAPSGGRRIAPRWWLAPPPPQPARGPPAAS